MDLKELEELMLVLQKQNNVKNFTVDEVMQIKQKYVEGKKIRLIKMYDYINPVPEGTEGIIDFVDDMGTLHINWENGRSIGLVIGIDEFETL